MGVVSPSQNRTLRTWSALEKGGLAVVDGGHAVLKKEARLRAAAAATFC
jgi:hypothetical protein